MRSSIIAGVVLLAAAASAQAQTAAAAPNACLTCHASQQDGRLAGPAALFSQQDVHREKGFACAECHGGNASATDKVKAHDATRGYKGKPSGSQVVATCARCHSDAELMRRYAPKQRVDQAAEYATSVHGKRLASGDANVATCVSCHGAHGVRLVSDAKSPVFPTSVATTCAACHSDAKRMASYKLPDGKPLPTHQIDDYRKSVHYSAMTKGNDLSAPTCNDCHGNHGAVPPGVGAVANVCGACHTVFAEKFATSVHKEIFDKGCVECHSNHAILKPSDDLLGVTGNGLCGTCHTAGDKDDKGSVAAETMRARIEALKSGIENSRVLIAGIKNAGIDVSDQELALREAGTKLTLARTEMHAFQPTQVVPIIAEGTKIVADVDAAGAKGVAELRFRRRGLAVSLGAILIVVIGLALKVRQLGKRQAQRT